MPVINSYDRGHLANSDLWHQSTKRRNQFGLSVLVYLMPVVQLRYHLADLYDHPVRQGCLALDRLGEQGAGYAGGLCQRLQAEALRRVMDRGHGPLPLIRRHAVFDLGFRIGAQMELLFPSIGFLADQMATARLDMASPGDAGIDIGAAKEFCLGVEVIAQQALGIGFETFGRDRLAGVAVEAVLRGAEKVGVIGGNDLRQGRLDRLCGRWRLVLRRGGWAASGREGAGMAADASPS